jgi:excinuclease ABC subunit A
MIRLRSSRAKSRDDWIIDLGPEGGDKGGEIVATGVPEDVVQVERSYTGAYLKPLLEGAGVVPAPAASTAKPRKRAAAKVAAE